MSIYRTIGLILTWFFRAFLIVGGFGYLYYGDVVGFIMYMLTFVLTLLPIMVGQLYKVKLHWVVGLTVSFMLAVHMLGFMGAYLWIPFFDDIAHILGSILLAFIGFALVYSLNYSEKIRLSLPKMGIFTFIWTIGIGALWEIIEFTWDNISVLSHEYGFSQNSLLDTMTDLSFDAMAGVCVAIFCVFLIRHIEKKSIKGFFAPFAKIIQHK